MCAYTDIKSRCSKLPSFQPLVSGKFFYFLEGWCMKSSFIVIFIVFKSVRYGGGRTFDFQRCFLRLPPFQKKKKEEPVINRVWLE